MAANGNGKEKWLDTVTPPEWGEHVAGNHCAVAVGAEGDVARTVTWRGNNFEAANRFAAGQASVRWSLHLRPTARQPALDDLLAGEDASIKLAHRNLNVRTESILEGVKRADVVEMAVSESDPLDLAARLRRGCDQTIGGSAERRINERKAIVLAHEVGVNRAKSGDLKQVIAKLGGPHGFQLRYWLPDRYSSNLFLPRLARSQFQLWIKRGYVGLSARCPFRLPISEIGSAIIEAAA
jgi:hypothetical protein